MKLVTVIQVFTILILIASASKVRNRLSGETRNATVRAIMPSLKPGSTRYHLMPKQIREIWEIMLMPYKDIKFVDSLGMKVGDRLPNGSFDGAIGAAAAGKGDIIIQFVNPAIFDVDEGVPGHIGPIAFDGQLAIMSTGQPSETGSSTLLGFFYFSVDGTFYLYFVICTFIFIIFYTIFVIICRVWYQNERFEARKARLFVKKIRKRRSVNAFTVIKSITNCFWLIAEVLLLTDSTVKPKVRIFKTISLKILTFSLIICVYYALDMVLWNYLSADLAVDLPEKYIDRIADLINATNMNGSLIVPAILTDYGAMNYLRSSTNEDEKNLLKYILCFPPKSAQISFVHWQELNKGLSIIEKVSSGEWVLIERKFGFSYVPILCYGNPKLLKRLHISKETFGGGYFTYFYGKSMSYGQVNDMNFHLTNLREMGFFLKGILRQGPELMVKEQSGLVESVIEGMKCENEIIEKVARDPRYDPGEVVSFSLKTFNEVFNIYFYGNTLSFIQLLIEIVFDVRKLE